MKKSRLTAMMLSMMLIGAGSVVAQNRNNNQSYNQNYNQGNNNQGNKNNGQVNNNQNNNNNQGNVKPGNNQNNNNNQGNTNNQGNSYNKGSQNNPPQMNGSMPSTPNRPSKGSGGKSYTSVMGIPFGTSIDNSFSTLNKNKYSIAYSDRNTIYVSNVNVFGLTWPTVALRYNNGLYAAQYEYNNSRNYQSSYNTAYKKIRASYGEPYSDNKTKNGRTTTWWSGNNKTYITLSYTTNGVLTLVMGK